MITIKEGKYYYEKICNNCDTLNHLEIPKGKTISEYLDETKCPNCGCDMRSN